MYSIQYCMHILEKNKSSIPWHVKYVENARTVLYTVEILWEM